MSRPRDSQRIKVYRAGWEFEELLPGRYMPNIRGIQAWVNGIVGSEWWRERKQYGTPFRVVVKDGRGRRNGGARRTLGMTGALGVITLPRKVRHEGCILHELAHLMATLNVPAAWHGRVFVQNWLALVDQWMGELEGAALRWFLAKNRVKWEEPCEPKRSAVFAAHIFAGSTPPVAAPATATARSISRKRCVS